MKGVRLGIYAFTWCNTLSAVFKKGKITLFGKSASQRRYSCETSTLQWPKNRPQCSGWWGKHFLFAIFGPKNTDDLDIFATCVTWRLLQSTFIVQIGCTSPMASQVPDIIPLEPTIRHNSCWMGKISKWKWKNFP